MIASELATGLGDEYWCTWIIVFLLSATPPKDLSFTEVFPWKFVKL
jgi:hypothetical protein